MLHFRKLWQIRFLSPVFQFFEVVLATCFQMLRGTCTTEFTSCGFTFEELFVSSCHRRTPLSTRFDLESTGLTLHTSLTLLSADTELIC